MPCLTGTNCTETGTAYVWTDHLNTPRELTRVNGSGQHVSIWKWDSLPFGETTPNGNPSNLGVMTFNHRFPGQYYDKETGLHQNWNREYDPKIGRYIQSDPIGLDGGVNTYVYAENAPTLSVDPLGKWTISISSFVGGKGGSIIFGQNPDGSGFVSIRAGVGSGSSVKFDPIGKSSTYSEYTSGDWSASLGGYVAGDINGGYWTIGATAGAGGTIGTSGVSSYGSFSVPATGRSGYGLGASGSLGTQLTIQGGGTCVKRN